MKQYVVNTANENHFFNNINDAKKDFNRGVDAIKKMQDKGDVTLFEMPANKNEDISSEKHFFNCLENRTVVEIKKETV